MSTRFLLKTLLEHPPEGLGRVLEDLDSCEDIGQWETLYLNLSRELARSAMEARLSEVSEPAEVPCPRCERSEPPWPSSEAGLSPP